MVLILAEFSASCELYLELDLDLWAGGLADLLGDLEVATRLGDLESALRGDLEAPDLLGDLLGDLEFAARLGDLESALRGDLEFPALLGDLEVAALLGDLEVLPAGDLDLFDPGDASLAFLAGDRSLDLIIKD